MNCQIEHCLSCNTNNALICNNCEEKYFLKFSSCIKIDDPHCISYSNENQCTKCEKHYYQMRMEQNVKAIRFIQTEKVTITYEEFYAMYKLSKSFEITRLTHELEPIFFSKICEDLTFSIETFIYSESQQEEIENDLFVNIETFLSERINESLSNKHFCRLPVTTHIWLLQFIAFVLHRYV